MGIRDSRSRMTRSFQALLLQIEANDGYGKHKKHKNYKVTDAGVNEEKTDKQRTGSIASGRDRNKQVTKIFKVQLLSLIHI